MASAKGRAKGAAAKKKRKRASRAKQPKCAGTTTTGKPCRNKAKAGDKYCSIHAGPRRASKFDDPAVREKVLAFIRSANYKVEAARAAGIDRTTLASWLERGEADIEAGVDSAYSAFSLAYDQAEAEAEAILVGRLQKNSSEGDTRATLELLKRRFRERWGDRVTAEVTGDVAASEVRELSKLTVAEREMLLDLEQKMQDERNQR